MFWTILALLTLIILGGFISYYGDLQGRRWGKRRVSWFGLRPKHTAILITSLTGAFISLLSVVTLLLISPTVREVVLRGERAIEDNKRLIAQDVETNRQYKIQSAIAAENLENSNKNVQQSHEMYKVAQADLNKLKAVYEPLKAKVADLREQVKQESETVAKLDRISKNLARANTQLSDSNKVLSKQNIGLERTNIALARTNSRLAANNSKLQASNKELQSNNAELVKENEVRKRVIADSIQQSSDYEMQLSQKRAQLDQVNSELEQANRKLDEANNRLTALGQSFSQSYFALRQGKISVRAGSELARRTLDAHMRPEAVRRQLELLLQDASDNALRYGARTGSNGRAVRIVSKLVLTPTGAQEANEDDSLSALADALQGSNKPIVVVVNAVSNALDGEQIMVELSPHSVDQIFDAGQVLASRHIDGNQPEDQVQQMIAQFLQTDVRGVALKAGTIPQVDPSSGISQIGSFDPLDLAHLTEQVRRMRGSVLLRAVAVAPITSADPLSRQNLRLDIERTQ